MKAMPLIKYGFEITTLPPLVAIIPPPKMIIAIFAPSTAELETPSVEGDAITLFDIVCIITPLIDKAIPAKIAAIILGNLML